MDSIRLLIIRHGKALNYETAERSGISDYDRPLTDVGREKLQAASKGLRVLLPALDAIFVSPLLRTQQTAEIIGANYPRIQRNTAKQLSSGTTAEQVIIWLNQLSIQSGETVALVGHEPTLSSLIGTLLSGERTSFIEFRPGSACLLKLPLPADNSEKQAGTRQDSIAPGQAELLWLLDSEELAAVGKTNQ